jgi:hypothetical protein
MKTYGISAGSARIGRSLDTVNETIQTHAQVPSALGVFSTIVPVNANGFTWNCQRLR